MNNGIVRESQCAYALVAGSRDNIGVAPGLCIQDNTDGCGDSVVLLCCDVHGGKASKTGHFGNYVCKDPDSMAVGDEDPIASDTFDQQEYRKWVAPKAMPAVSAASATY